MAWTWKKLDQKLRQYATLPRKRRRQFLFRGQCDSRWGLETTLDRRLGSVSPDEREARLQELMTTFRYLCAGLHPRAPLWAADDLRWQLLARHHGLPTPFIDWTESPYVAAYFAFDEPAPKRARAVRLWVLNRDVFPESKNASHVEILDDDPDMMDLNPRAVEQRAVFMHVGRPVGKLNVVLRSAITFFDVGVKDRGEALAHLDAMGIHAKSLFRDLDAAARLAARRVLES